MRLKNLGHEVAFLFDFSAGEDMGANGVVTSLASRLGRWVTRQKLPVGLLRYFKQGCAIEKVVRLVDYDPMEFRDSSPSWSDPSSWFTWFSCSEGANEESGNA
jgi:hypothetical protein